MLTTTGSHQYLLSMMNMISGSRWWIDVRCFALLVVLILPQHCWGIDEHPHPGNIEGSEGNVVFFWANVSFTYNDPESKKVTVDSFTGKYGSRGKVEQQTGLAVHVRTRDNKTHGCQPYGIKIPSEKWIAVVERGDCYFSDKIKIATKDYNASAVVIYNNEPGDMITNMQHDIDDQISIFVTQDTGRKLIRLTDNGVRVIVTILPGPKGFSDASSNSISKTSVLFVSISFIVLMIISLAWLVFYYIQRFRYAHAKERLARRLASAAKKAIAKIPQKAVKNGDKELDSEFDMCSICIEGYKPHDVIRTLPCRHVFHRSCVDPWLLDQRSCPMCKLDILRAYGMQFQVFGNQEDTHRDVENGAVMMPAEDHEPSSITDDQVITETEVKVLLLPHICLHFHSNHDSGSTATSMAVGESNVGELHSSSSLGEGAHRSSSNDRLASCSPHSVAINTECSEKQALISAAHEYDEDFEEDRFQQSHLNVPFKIITKEGKKKEIEEQSIGQGQPSSKLKDEKEFARK